MLKRGHTTISTEVDFSPDFPPRTEKIQVTGEDLEKLEEARVNDPDLLWEIRVIFGATKPKDDQPGGRRQVGIFVFSPPKLESDPESLRQLTLPTSLETELETREHFQDIQKTFGRLYLEEIYAIDPGPSGIQVVNPGTLIERLMRIWRGHPILTNGFVELSYPPSIRVTATRSDMLQEASRAAFLYHVQKILDIIGKSFRWDPWAGRSGALRRVGPEGVGPWAKKR